MESEVLQSKYDANLGLSGYSISPLKWVFLDHSSLWRAGLSWSIFSLLNVAVPLASHLLLSCSDCDAAHRRPYDAVVQLSLSLFAAISFFCLSSFARRYGFRRFLFFDKLSGESEKVREGYADQLNRSMKILSSFVLPCFLADSVYKVWWFTSVGTQIPSFYNINLTKIVACTLLMCSWLYRTSICFLVCVLFRLTCQLQILKLEDYTQVFDREFDVAPILIQHLRIRRNLRVISHRFRLFVLSSLILVTLSQLISLLVVMKPSSNINIPTAGELTLCSITLVTGLFICLRSAAKITHKAQAITSLATKWHACSTITSLDQTNNETQIVPLTSSWDDDGEDDERDNPSAVPRTISYEKRQALATYFEHNKAGITVYGFLLDRMRLRAIFLIQFTLTMWILKKTIVI